MMNSTPIINTDSRGTRRWHRDDKLHRTDGPAVEYAVGSKKWYLNGKLHRTNGPAVEEADGTTKWWVHGKDIGRPYSHVLTAVFNRGLPIPDEAILEMVATPKSQSNSGQIGTLKAILNKYWPMHVKKILVTLFSDSDPDIKHIAFSLLGREVLQKSMPSVTSL